MWRKPPLFSYSVGERKLMKHFVVNKAVKKIAVFS